VRGTLKGIGYTDATYGIDGGTCAVMTTIDQQSPDIAMGVEHGRRGRPGDDVRLRDPTRTRS
jgi:S-adenosylmethionine synthetase